MFDAVHYITVADKHVISMLSFSQIAQNAPRFQIFE